MITLLEFTLSDARERVDDPDADVFLANVAIIVCEYLENVLSVFAQTVEEVKDAVLAIVLRVAGVEHSEEEVVDEDADSLLEMLTEMEEEQMEYRHCSREDLLLRGHCKLKQGAAERITDSIYEFSAMYKGLTRILKARMNQIET